MKLSLLINMKMPTIVGIFILLAEKISCSVELIMKTVYNLGAFSPLDTVYGKFS